MTRVSVSPLQLVTDVLLFRQLPPTSYWNTTGRGFPDVSLLANPYVAVSDLLVIYGQSGTECATPAFSGMMALLNDIRLQNGKSPLGFLNPLLYDMAEKYPQTFSDITQGMSSFWIELLLAFFYLVHVIEFYY